MGSNKWVISRLIWVTSIVTPLISPLMITHEPPSEGSEVVFCSSSEGLDNLQ